MLDAFRKIGKDGYCGIFGHHNNLFVLCFTATAEGRKQQAANDAVCSQFGALFNLTPRR